MQADGDPGLGLHLRGLLRADLEHQVRSRSLLPDPDVQAVSVDLPEHAHLLSGPLCLHDDVQVQPQQTGQRGPARKTR